jgi:hypothetical protein
MNSKAPSGMPRLVHRLTWALAFPTLTHDKDHTLITINPKVAKSVRKVFAKALDLGRRHEATQLLELVAGAEGLTIHASTPLHAVQYYAPGIYSPERMLVPWQLLRDVESSSGPITLETSEGKVITARWHDGDVPRQARYEPAEGSEAPFPPEPADFTAMESGFFAALHEAMSVTDPESSRFALGCVQLTASGTMTGTDGRQALLQTGFAFPFAQTVLVRATSAFACAEISEGETSLALTDEHLVIRTGCWTFYRGLAKEGRFPHVDDLVPPIESATSVVSLAAVDAHFLMTNLRRLPGAKENHAPVTMEINGCVLVRAKGEADTTATELLLSNSANLAADARLAMDRRFLERAAHLKLPTLRIFGERALVLCHDERRQYIWMALHPSCAIAATEQMTRIQSQPMPSARRLSKRSALATCR